MALALAIVAAQPARSVEVALLPPPVGVGERIATHQLTGFALNGFDPVTYFLEAGPRPGHPGLEALWDGVAWRFESEANLRAFLSRPEVFAPRFGGHDAQAVARGLAVEANPFVYAIAEGRLYLFRSEGSRRAFIADAALRRAAEAAWPQVAHELPQP